MSPIKRYPTKTPKRCERLLHSCAGYFHRKEARKVNKDRSVKLDGKTFEAPTGLVGMLVTLLKEVMSDYLSHHITLAGTSKNPFTDAFTRGPGAAPEGHFPGQPIEHRFHR